MFSRNWKKLSSVGEVSLAGGQKEYVSVCLDPEKMAQYNLSLSTIGQLVGAADFAIPAGDVNVGKQELNVSAGNDYDDVESLNNVAIPLADGNVIHLSDIATVPRHWKKKIPSAVITERMLFRLPLKSSRAQRQLMYQDR